MRYLFAVFAIGLAYAVCACSWLTPAHVIDVAEIVGCVLEHDSEPIEQIGFECAVQDQQQIRDILAAHKAAMKREAACAR